MTTQQGSPGPSILRLEKSLLEAMDAALDEADWRALDDLLNILTSLTLRTSQKAVPATLH